MTSLSIDVVFKHVEPPLKNMQSTQIHDPETVKSTLESFATAMEKS
jgi:hypothetical protein